MEMSVHIDNQPFKVIYNQQGQKQWRLQPWGILVRSRENKVALMQHHHEDIDVTLEYYPPAHHTVTGSGLSSGRLQDTDLK